MARGEQSRRPRTVPVQGESVVTVRAYYDVWCDGPGPDGGGCLSWADQATSLLSVRDARKRAKRDGWVHKRGVGDLCPDCQERVAAHAALAEATAANAPKT